jgi:hypothetical protein
VSHFLIAMLNAIMLSAVKVRVIMLSVVMLRVIRLNVVLLSVVAPNSQQSLSISFKSYETFLSASQKARALVFTKFILMFEG